MSSVIQGRQGSQGGPTGLNSGDAVFSDKNLWVKSFAAVMDQKDSSQANGFSADVYGVGMGMDGEIASGDQLGLSLFYTRAQADTNNLDQESDMDMVSLMAYGSRDLTPDKDITLYWQAGAGIQDTESSRYISSLDSNAKAQYTATNLFAQTRAVRAFQLRENLRLTGGAVVSYAWIHTPSYSESGAGGMNLSVDSNNTQALVPGLEGGLSWGLPTDLNITARVALGYYIINDDASVTAIFQGAGTAFTTQGVDNSPVVFGAGVGISKKLTQRLSLDASYDLEGQGSDFLSHMVSCKLNWTL
jgi:outer membrane autotransporter protein